MAVLYDTQKDMPKCMNTDLILNRGRKQSCTLTILDHPHYQIKIEGSEPNGSDKKKVFRLQSICKKIAKGQEFKILQFYESIIISFSGGFIN